MEHRLRRPLAFALSTVIAANPLVAAAANIVERPVIAPVEIKAAPAPIQTLGALTIPQTAIPSLNLDAALPAPLSQIEPAAAGTPAPDSSIKELAGAGEKLVSSDSPAATAGTLDVLYDKSKPGASAETPMPTNASNLSSPPPAIPASVLVNGRLPRTIVPKTYTVSLRVDPDREGFSGRVKIDVVVAKPTKTVVLHSLGHEIKSVRVGGKSVPLSAVKVDPVTETVSVSLSQPLKAGASAIEIEYSGAYNKQMRGLYESKAKFEGKEERYAFTHLEPTNARRVFPAFDEPDFKAAFKLTVTAPEHLTVLSNMPPESRKTDAGWQTVTFGQTPKMSTYLFGLAVARLTPVSRMVGKTKITVWTMPADAGQAGFALDTAEQALTRLNKYFGLPYQLPKMDLVAVPDFAAGAMENWGAIFFRDSALLIDPKLSSTKAKRRVAEVVTHEIVHQWFGNLVTMKWWNDLWLNEAFATWMAYKMVEGWKPEWNEWIEFESRKREPLSIDALKSTRAISAGVSSTSEIQAQFDPLTYSKGGALLRMIEGYLGEAKFRKGIQAYMKTYRYKNTSAVDLWRALEKASGQPVMKLAEDWLTKPGYPVVAVDAVSKDGRKLALTQKRFSASGTEGALSQWTVPVVLKYRLSGEKKTKNYRALLKAGELTVTLPGRGEVLWVYPNVDETGFYRVKLSPSLLEKTRKAAASSLSALERMGLLNHLWAQAKSGDLPIEGFLETVVALRKDGSRIVLEEVSGYLKALSENLAATPEDKAAVARMTEALLAPHWKKLGWDAKKSEGDEPRLARTALLSALGTVAPDRALETGLKERLSEYLADPAGIDPTLVSPILNLNARLGTTDFDAYRSRMAGATTPETRDAFLMALAQFRDPALARRLLAMTLTDEIRGQDAWKPFGALFSNTAVQAETWDFVRANWKALREKLGPRGAERVIAATAGLQTSAWLDEVRTFFNAPENRLDSAKRTLDQTLEAIELGVRFKQAQAPELSRWLSRRYPSVK